MQARKRPKNPLAKRRTDGDRSQQALVAAIRGKQALQNSALDNLMAKYAPNAAGKKKGAGMPPDISDAEFEAMRARLEANRRRT